MTTETSGEWREERLFVLRAIDELKAEQRRQIEADAVMRQATAVKAAKDIDCAHDKIRALEGTGMHLQIKVWVMGAALSTAGVVLFEVLKWFLTK